MKILKRQRYLKPNRLWLALLYLLALAVFVKLMLFLWSVAHTLYLVYSE